MAKSAVWRTKAQRDACVEQIFNLDLQSALERYGIEFRYGRGKFALCPFHPETAGSFGVKNNYWHCFGCNESGGLIRFVSKRFNISTADAIEKICIDFGLVADPHVNRAAILAATDASQVRRKIIEAKQKAAEADYLDALSAFMDANDELSRAYGIDPFSKELSDAHWKLIKARYILEISEDARSAAYSRR